MKIGVISDTHGDHGAIRLAVQMIPDADVWLHAGDYSQDATYLARLVSAPVFAAKGNCDGLSTAKVDEFVEVAGKKIWITHGHRYSVKQSVAELVQWGKQYEVDVVVFGHTHLPDNQQCEGILIFNPGSAGEPRVGHGTFGILEIDNKGTIIGYIIELNN